MSALFDFNASLNDAAPVFQILLPVEFIRTERSELSIDAIVCCFYVHNRDRAL